METWIYEDISKGKVLTLHLHFCKLFPLLMKVAVAIFATLLGQIQLFNSFCKHFWTMIIKLISKNLLSGLTQNNFYVNHKTFCCTLQITTTKLLRIHYKNVVIWILLLRIKVYHGLLYFLGGISCSSKCPRPAVVCSQRSWVRFPIPSMTNCSNFYNEFVVL